MKQTYFILILLSILLCGCKKNTIAGKLDILNESGQTLYIESTIYCEQYPTGEPFVFVLKNGEAQQLTITTEFVGTELLPIASIVPNKETASVSLYTLSETGEKQYVRTWSYKERNMGGRQLFHESCLTLEIGGSVSWCTCYIYYFTVLPEDLIVNE